MGALEEYQSQLELFQISMMHFSREQNKEDMQKQLIEKEEDAIDIEDSYNRRAKQEVQEQKIQIEKLEEFLNAPENKEKAGRLKAIKGELYRIDEEERESDKKQAVWESDIKRLEPDIERQKNNKYRYGKSRKGDTDQEIF